MPEPISMISGTLQRRLIQHTSVDSMFIGSWWNWNQ